VESAIKLKPFSLSLAAGISRFARGVQIPEFNVLVVGIDNGLLVLTLA